MWRWCVGGSGSGKWGCGGGGTNYIKKNKAWHSLLFARQLWDSTPSHNKFILHRVTSSIAIHTTIQATGSPRKVTITAIVKGGIPAVRIQNMNIEDLNKKLDQELNQAAASFMEEWMVENRLPNFKVILGTGTGCLILGTGTGFRQVGFRPVSPRFPCKVHVTVSCRKLQSMSPCHVRTTKSCSGHLDPP